jgi:hypothetical protein
MYAGVLRYTTDTAALKTSVTATTICCSATVATVDALQLLQRCYTGSAYLYDQHSTACRWCQLCSHNIAAIWFTVSCTSIAALLHRIAVCLSKLITKHFCYPHWTQAHRASLIRHKHAAAVISLQCWWRAYLAKNRAAALLQLTIETLCDPNTGVQYYYNHNNKDSR